MSSSDGPPLIAGAIAAYEASQNRSAAIGSALSSGNYAALPTGTHHCGFTGNTIESGSKTFTVTPPDSSIVHGVVKSTGEQYSYQKADCVIM